MSTVVQAKQIERIPTSMPKADPCLLVIFGASGDLTKRKLIPALYDLACEGCMSSHFEVLGVGRTPMTDDQFREAMHEFTAASKDARNYTEEKWKSFQSRLHYITGDPNNTAFFGELRARMEQMVKDGAAPNYLFYVSTPASVAGPVIEGLGAAGLNHNEKGWSRIVLEKPFGRDLDSARTLNQGVAKVFDEKYVYRIDHYLGKETVQNLMVFRFGNSLFEPVWNRNYVQYVEITAIETLGVEKRASFYEETGALRDMVANHMLQLLTITAMEPPIGFDADSVREQKVQVLRSMRPMSVDQVAKHTVRGQYGPGVIDGQPVRGYREEPGVRPDSTTETYAALEFYIDNWRWAGVPFFLRTGKRMPRHLTEIKVHFKRTPQALFARTPSDEIDPNVITVRVQPNEGISMNFGAKRPGPQMKTVSVNMDFSYAQAFGHDTPVAYETLLLDSMRGDATLFTRRDEVESEWRIITPIEDAWAELPPPKFPNYAAGSAGPEDAYSLIMGENRRWSNLI